MREQLLQQIRQALHARGLDGIYLGRADRFQGEEVRACDEFLQFVTGFTGSAGALVMLADEAAVFSDSRYLLQMEQQLDDSLFSHFDSSACSAFDWIKQQDKPLRLGFDGWQISAGFFSQMQQSLPQIEWVALEDDFLATFWEGRPAFQPTPVWWVDEVRSGRPALEKIDDYCAAFTKKGADYGLITSAESVNWLLNMRGRDLAYTPIHLCYALVSAAGQVHLIGADDSAAEHGVQVTGFHQLAQLLEQLNISDNTQIAGDKNTLPFSLMQMLEARGATLTLAEEPLMAMKAVKNPAELAGFRQAHLTDGLAMVEFSYWLKEQAPLSQLSESDIAEHLCGIRAKSDSYICDSFATISGFNAQGAIVHYRAIKGQDSRLQNNGVLLVDSGAHYQMGSTDITRCYGFGEVSELAIKASSLVLAAHAELAMSIFPAGTNGVQLDAITRRPLWQSGMDYGHGTGHGVGHMLGVHEGPVSLSKRGGKPVAPGHILSNEPGYYEAGAFGIRHENLVHVTHAPQPGMLCFETLTLCPFDRGLIDKRYLTASQREWIDAYHAEVYEQLSPHLNANLAAWLAAQTAPLS